MRDLCSSNHHHRPRIIFERYADGGQVQLGPSVIAEGEQRREVGFWVRGVYVRASLPVPHGGVTMIDMRRVGTERSVDLVLLAQPMVKLLERAVARSV